MTSTVQQIAGLEKALQRLEERIKRYRSVLWEIVMDRHPDVPMEDVAITEVEVAAVETLIISLAKRIGGSEPDKGVWERLHPYCSRVKDKRDSWSWAEDNHEYFRCALLWIQGTRSYLTYLEGLSSAAGDPQSSGDSQQLRRVDSSEATVSYDVALSFAGEDRRHAKELAEKLRGAGFSVFYDEYEQSTLWGRNLYSHLSEVYQNKARYCVMFISEHYAKKLWTRRERESAQARAFKESSEYILPLRIDDTALPGLEDTVGYIDLRTSSIDAVFDLLAEKLSRHKSSSARPITDGEAERALLHTLPSLSEAARELLAEAAASEDGLVVNTDGYSGHIEANGRQFVDATSPRSEARWKAALRELCDSGLLEDQRGEGEVFSVTERGYSTAEQLKAAKGRPTQGLKRTADA